MSRLDYHNGKTVIAVSPTGTITLEDGQTIPQHRLISGVGEEIVNTKLLKVEQGNDNIAHLSFGHPNPHGGDPEIVAVVEATGDDLSA